MDIKFIKKFAHVGKKKEDTEYYESGVIVTIDKDIPVKYANIAVDSGYAEKVEKTKIETKKKKKKK